MRGKIDDNGDDLHASRVSTTINDEKNSDVLRVKLLEAEDKRFISSDEGRQFLHKTVNASTLSRDLMAKNMSEYLRQRFRMILWPPAPSDMSQNKSDVRFYSSSERISSDLLTYPLTLGYALHHMFLKQPWLKDLAHDRYERGGLRITVLGARAEASLPKLWWRETILSVLLSDTENVISVDKRHMITLSFLGPDVKRSTQASPDPIIKAITSNGGINLETNQSKSSSSSAGIWNMGFSNVEKPSIFLHEHPQCSKILLDSDLFVLFNPGYGVSGRANDPSKDSWRDTIRLLMQSRKPVIATGYSEHDVNRDLQRLHEISEEYDNEGQQLGAGGIDMFLKNHSNPYGSLKYVYDAKEDAKSQIFAKNSYIYGFHGI